jgi:segregation and condensation protein B
MARPMSDATEGDDMTDGAVSGDAAGSDQAASLGPGQADLSGAADGDDDDFEREGPGLYGAVTVSPEDLAGALEALILVSDKPIAVVRLARLTRQDVGVVRQKLEELTDRYRNSGIVLDEIAGGFQFRTSPRYAPFVRNLVQQKPTKLSKAQLEVLAIIAYRQPVTRPEVEDVRGVDSGSALKVLLERAVIKIIGKRDDAGRPMLYGTTNEFLELFGLKSLRDLPTLKEFAELTPESRDMFERRIGEPVPDQGMNLETHYEAAARPPDDDGESDAEPESQSDGAPAAEAASTSDDEPSEPSPDEDGALEGRGEAAREDAP